MTNAQANGRVIWRDGEFVPWEDATVHVLAQSLQRGSLAFDYMAVHQTAKGSAIFRLADHIARLLNTCEVMGLPIVQSVAELMDAVKETVRRNPGARSVRISALFPSVEVELVPQDTHIAVFIAAYDSRADIIAGKTGKLHFAPQLSLKVERHKRGRREDLIPPQAKVAASYTPSLPAKWQARREGYDDIILLDESDNLTEAPTSNLFLVTGAGTIATPTDAQALRGITRDSVMQIAADLGFAVEERVIGVEELDNAQEVFMTGTSVGVWPVVRIDGKAVGNGEIGNETARLKARFDAVTRGEVAAFADWLHHI
ncbi:MAG: hypothetical protein CMQ29_00660 [Gammaproteobacteria bacterium]|nr:hypothetical protein [Gammaproteobacteria bacterium]